MRLNRWHDWWQKRRMDAAALAAVALAFLVAFGWAIFRGKFLIGGDVFFYTYPMRTVAWRMIRAGTLPLWTPHVLSGFPMLAMVQLGLGYPLTWTHLFLPDHWAEEVYVLTPFLFAPAFTYAYVRELGRSRLAALLAGLAFGYGGLTTNTLGMNAIPTNAMMWLPLLLIALERAHTGRMLPALLGATAACALSVLTGHAQSFLLVALVALAYALFLAFSPIAAGPRTRELATMKPAHTFRQRASARTWLGWPRWRPLFVVACSLALAFGVAAFQILETLRAARRSIRHEITYDFFSQGSFTPREALLSFAAPLYHYIDVTTYVAPLAFALVCYAIVHAAQQRSTGDLRVWFWLIVAVIALILMLGEHTPFYWFVYRVPVLNQFRIPSRHAFEWTFALAVLAAYGWDALCRQTGPRLRATNGAQKPISTHKQLFVDALLLALSAGVGALWWLSVNRRGIPGSLADGKSERVYLTLKILLAAGVLLIVWRNGRGAAARGSKGILACALVLGCMCEPLVLISQWWPGTAKPAARFNTPGRATRYLQEFAPAENRVYMHVNAGVDENAPVPRFDVLDQTALYGLHNVAGYEPLLLERYSRALGDVDYDAVRPRAGHALTRELFGPQSHVLDLLNTTFVVAFSDLAIQPIDQLISRGTIGFASTDLALELKPGASIFVSGANSAGDTLALVTSLANSVALEHGVPVARLRIFTTGGRMVELNLRAGLDTSEWAHERADVRAAINHGRAPVFDSGPGDEANSFPANRYWTQLPLGMRTTIDRIEITNITQSASLTLWKATLYDSGSAQSSPLTNQPMRPPLDPARWRKATEFDGVLILRNARALPRAWLVSEAESVDGEEALQRIRGESTHEFDPTRTALLEVKPDELPSLPGGALPPESNVRITNYEPNRLRIETNSSTPTLLVVSEIFYPGWVATMDGQPTRIMLTDYLLRGVALPAGVHTIEMRYAAPAARTGALISAFTLLLLCGLAVYARRQAGLERKHADSNRVTFL